MITISYNGSSFTYPNLAQHPLAFDAQQVTRGRTAEALDLSGLLLKPQADSLLAIFRAWRNAKLPEEPPERTGSVGATVAVSGGGPGFSWSNRACWFREAPACEQVGPFTRVRLSVVDANQALAILLRDIEEGQEEPLSTNQGTLTLGGAVINLTARPDSRADLPRAELSPSGAHIITGPLTLSETREVRGWVTAADLTTLESWVNTTVATTPAANSWFPTAWTTPTAFLRRDAGTVTTAYEVGLTLVKIRG